MRKISQEPTVIRGSKIFSIKVIVEPFSSVDLLASYKSQPPPWKYVIFRLATFFDEIDVFIDNISELDFLKQEPYGKFSNNVQKKVLKGISRFATPTEENIQDLKRIYREPSDSPGGSVAFLCIRSLLSYAQENSFYLYTYPGFREGFVSFCLKYQPDYLPLMKDSFLLSNILEYLFESEVPSFDPEKLGKMFRNFLPFKKDFQQGILQFNEDLKGSYRLSEDQKEYMRQEIASKEQQLLELLKPENIKKIRLDFLDLLAEGVSLVRPIPAGILVDVAKQLLETRVFKQKNLNFILSLYILKKMTNIRGIREIPKCVVCSLSLTEIENMTEEDCEKVLLSGKMCVEHMASYLEFRKRYRLWGKGLLTNMKKFGDSIIFADNQELH